MTSSIESLSNDRNLGLHYASARGCIECVQMILESSQEIRYVVTVKPIIIFSFFCMTEKWLTQHVLRSAQRTFHLLTNILSQVQFYITPFRGLANLCAPKDKPLWLLTTQACMRVQFQAGFWKCCKENNKWARTRSWICQSIFTSLTSSMWGGFGV